MPGPGPAAPAEIGDAVLDRLRRGDISALEEVFDCYGGRVFGVCYGILGNHGDAEDATQDALLRALQQVAKFGGKGRFSAWLLRLATNHTLNLARAEARRRRLAASIAEQVAEHAPAADRASLAEERRQAVVALLQQLPVEQRQVLVLREVEGSSYAEIAEILAIPVGTVTSRLLRGRELFRKLVGESDLSLDGLG